ncbi:DUF4255 domain-containing protein [Ferribacterium limneticum]|uniref:DUF4255 domain-containing protein n=1 Tax=Ferribacterium limneticum TaxID=76259 RepID=UPI001CFABDFE|nr:DUF4255 domain-containing protein [Ferribacterium limneticum]UCV17570.1 DUF4255 domain-containing protein [Ferribacterium limneticum]
MSNALAIAGVTAVIKDLLDSGMIDQAITDAMGAGVVVSARAPDTIPLDDADGPQLNLFLHQVTPNAALRNAALPSRDATGNRSTNPPLALDLHYLLTAYGRAELQAEVLLGYALQLLHETPVLPRAAIRRALNPAVIDGAALPAIYHSLRGADLAEQVELLKITPSALSTEEMSRLWSALQAHYRPTIAFQVSVVLIESSKSARSPLPVLSRGETDPVSKRERGVLAFSGLTPPLPTLEAVVPAGRQPVAVPGGEVRLEGHHLDGVDRQVTFSLASFQISRSVPVISGSSAKVSLIVPNDLPVGLYRIELSVQGLGDAQARRTNQLPLALAPQAVLPPFNATRNGAAVTLVLDVAPPVRAGQTAALILGEREIAAEQFTATTSRLTFKIADAPEAGSTHLVRLRVDGFESPIIDRMATPTAYLDRRITLP